MSWREGLGGGGGGGGRLGTDGEDLHGLGEGVGQGADDEQPVQQVRRHPMWCQLVRAAHLGPPVGLWGVWVPVSQSSDVSVSMRLVSCGW